MIPERSPHGTDCQNLSHSYKCDCSQTGFEGDHCETDVLECGSNPCQHGGRCIDQVNGYLCLCWPGKTFLFSEVL